jgi:hypothetical protein
MTEGDRAAPSPRHASVDGPVADNGSKAQHVAVPIRPVAPVPISTPAVPNAASRLAAWGHTLSRANGGTPQPGTGEPNGYDGR